MKNARWAKHLRDFIWKLPVLRKVILNRFMWKQIHLCIILSHKLSQFKLNLYLKCYFLVLKILSAKICVVCLIKKTSVMYYTIISRIGTSYVVTLDFWLLRLFIRLLTMKLMLFFFLDQFYVIKSYDHLLTRNRSELGTLP